MLNEKEILYIQNEIRQIFSNDYSGHDYFHTLRVYRTALSIAKEENADLTIVSLAALLHDVDDYKLFGEKHKPCENAIAIMNSIAIPAELQTQVCTIINSMSFHSKDSHLLTSIEGKVVQDADRLDAIGAVGIARAFAYGGNHQRVMYDPDCKPKTNMSTEEYTASKGTTINHFYEKLLKLKDLMNTESAKKLANQRHAFMQEFLDEFYQEWEGKR